MPDNLWLIGMMGAGKSVVGRLVAESMGAAFVDVDSEVTARTGCSIATLWGESGEEAFRDMEAAAVKRIAATRGQVIATGGGVVLRDDNVEEMRGSGLVVWLRARPEVLAGRIEPDGTRPLLADGDAGERLDEILAERRHRYERAASLTVDTDDLAPTEVADAVEAAWTAS
ncbi:MAG: shikimate kinase [Acidimicrobiia bacterium]|nr:shikimate kinase [Acidimicrobiia bacterium]